MSTSIKLDDIMNTLTHNIEKHKEYTTKFHKSYDSGIYNKDIINELVHDNINFEEIFKTTQYSIISPTLKTGENGTETMSKKSLLDEIQLSREDLNFFAGFGVKIQLFPTEKDCKYYSNKDIKYYIKDSVKFINSYNDIIKKYNANDLVISDTIKSKVNIKSKFSAYK